MRRARSLVPALLALSSGCSLVMDAGDLSRGAGARGGASQAGGDDDGGSSAQVDAATGAAAIDPGFDDSSAVSDAGPVAPPTTVTSACPASALFCDGFESGAPRAWSTYGSVNSGAVTVDRQLVVPGGGSPFNGAYALHVSGGVNTAVAGVVHANTAHVDAFLPPTSTGMLVYRFYLYLGAPLAAETSLAKLAHRSASLYPEDINLKVTGTGTETHWRINTDNSVANDSNHDSTTSVTVGNWTCLEWTIILGPKGHLRLAADGQVIIDADENTVGAMGAGYDEARLGFSYSPGTVVQNAYFDDAAFARSPIGCE